MPWLEEQEALQDAPQAAGPDFQARLRDRRQASDPVRAVRPRSTHEVQTAAHVLCPVAARSQPAPDWYAQPLARPPPLASRAANPRRAWMRSTPVQARRQEGHRHGAARGDYPSDGQPLPQPNRWAQREHGLVPPAHGACSRRHQRAARRCAPRSTPPPINPPRTTLIWRSCVADTDDEEGEDEGEDEEDDAHYPPDAGPGPCGGRREEEDGSGGPGEPTTAP